MRRLVLVLSAGLLALPAAAAAAPSPSLFAYDAAAPLGLKEERVEERGGVRVTQLSYAGPKGGRVTAVLVAPTGAAARPGVVFLHDADASGRSARDEAEALARRGLVSLLPDSSSARPPFPPLVTFVAAKDRATRIKSAVEARRALDVLESRSEVDGTRLGIVGHGPGATSAAILSGIERRVDAFVLSGTGARITTLLRRLWGTSRVAARESYLRVQAPFDPVAWIGRAGPAPILFQHMRFDPNFRLAELRQLDRAAAAPKRVRTYSDDTETSATAQRDRAAFLLEALR